jgi:hypothetical protein
LLALDLAKTKYFDVDAALEIIEALVDEDENLVVNVAEEFLLCPMYPAAVKRDVLVNPVPDLLVL